MGCCRRRWRPWLVAALGPRLVLVLSLWPWPTIGRRCCCYLPVVVVGCPSSFVGHLPVGHCWGRCCSGNSGGGGSVVVVVLVIGLSTMRMTQMMVMVMVTTTTVDLIG